MYTKLELSKALKDLLNLKEDSKEETVELAEMKGLEGAVYTAESFEEGQQVFEVKDEEKVALPTGDYPLEDGKVMKVEEGVIKSIEDAPEAAEETPETSTEELEEDTKEEVSEYVTKAQFDELLNLLTELINSLPTTELSEEESTEDSKEEETTELSKEEDEKVEDDLKHTPNTGDVKLNKVENLAELSPLERIRKITNK